MNPFIDSTVAQPLQGDEAVWRRPRRRRQAQPALVPTRRPLSGVRPVATDQRDPVVPSAVRRVACQVGKWAGQRLKPKRQALCPRPTPHRSQRWRLSFSWMALAGLLALPGWAGAVDVNQATPEQLQTVRGIGPKTAQLIIDERTRGGRFESFEDLSERVKGIGTKKAQSLQAAGLKVAGAAAQTGAGNKATPTAKPR